MKMMDNNKLIEAAKFISMEDMVKRLVAIQKRLNDKNTELILPLVGEFSAGKTSLINSLADNKQLEISREPTTATIFEVHFGSDRQYAQVLWKDGRSEMVDDIGSLKRHVQADASLIHVYDTSSKVPSSIVLVDTPGLSSPDTKHKEALLGFLPYADAVLLVADVNQQLTRSLIDFVGTSQLAGRRAFLVLTQCDTKPKCELASVKKYIAENCKLPIGHVVCTSAKNGEHDELTALLTKIQSEKDAIISQVIEKQLQDSAKIIKKRLEEILKTPADNKSIEDAIADARCNIEQGKRKIHRLVDDLREEITEIQRDSERRFEDTVFNKLDALVAEKNVNFDAEARAIINGVCNIVLEDYKTKVDTLFRNNSDSDVLSSIDLSSYNVDGLSYNLKLNEVGHEYDAMLATGTKVVVAAATVATVVATAGGAAAGGAAVAEAGAAEAATTTATATTGMTLLGTADIAADVIDTATDVMSIQSNRRLMDRVGQTTTFIGRTSDMYSSVDNYNQQGGAQMGMKKGLIEGAVGFVTDALWGKPQRRRHLHIYIDGTLIPEFKSRINSVTNNVAKTVEETVEQAYEQELSEKTKFLNNLREQLNASKSEYESKMKKIREYYNFI